MKKTERIPSDLAVQLVDFINMGKGIVVCVLFSCLLQKELSFIDSRLHIAAIYLFQWSDFLSLFYGFLFTRLYSVVHIFSQ